MNHDARHQTTAHRGQRRDWRFGPRVRPAVGSGRESTGERPDEGPLDYTTVPTLSAAPPECPCRCSPATASSPPRPNFDCGDIAGPVGRSVRPPAPLSQAVRPRSDGPTALCFEPFGLGDPTGLNGDAEDGLGARTAFAAIDRSPVEGSRRRQRSTPRYARLSGARRCAGRPTVPPLVGSRPPGRPCVPRGRRRVPLGFSRCRGRRSLRRSVPAVAQGAWSMPMASRLRPAQTALRIPDAASQGRGSGAGSSQYPWPSGRSGRT